MTRAAWCAAAALLAACSAAAALQARRPEPAGDPIRLPATLAETGLYAADGVTIDPRHRAFVPQYPLWSDGLTKRRWVSLPDGAVVDARQEHAWDFPVGTRFWKEFSLAGRRVETRVLWKASAAGWLYGSYQWNEEGTAAVLAEDGAPKVAEVAPGRRHSIPSPADCAACHGAPASGGPLGFNALQLSTDRDPNAIHGEPLGDGMLTLRGLLAEGLLSPARTDLVASPPRIRTAQPATRAVLGYLAANCGACHNGRGEIAALGPVLRTEELVADGDAVARRMAGLPTSWQLPGTADGTVLVEPGAPERSALVARMRSRSPSSQMPPLGTVVRDEAAVDAVSRWIALELARTR